MRNRAPPCAASCWAVGVGMAGELVGHDEDRGGRCSRGRARAYRRQSPACNVVGPRGQLRILFVLKMWQFVVQATTGSTPGVGGLSYSLRRMRVYMRNLLRAALHRAGSFVYVKPVIRLCTMRILVCGAVVGACAGRCGLAACSVLCLHGHRHRKRGFAPAVTPTRNAVVMSAMEGGTPSYAGRQRALGFRMLHMSLYMMYRFCGPSRRVVWVVCGHVLRGLCRPHGAERGAVFGCVSGGASVAVAGAHRIHPV